MLGDGVHNCCVSIKKKMFLMSPVLAEVWKSGGILCYKYLSSGSLFFPPLGKLLGDGRDPIATAAFLLLAITAKQ